MQLSTSLLLFLSTLFLSSVFAQTQNQTQDFQVRCLRFPPNVSGNDTFNPDAITGLSQALADNSFNPQLPSEGIKLSPGYSTRIGWADAGGYQICVQNFWFLKTLTVPLADLSAAVANIGRTCCTDAEGNGGPPAGPGGRQGRCQDAKAVVKATDGSEVKVAAQDYGDRCCGMWGC